MKTLFGFLQFMVTLIFGLILGIVYWFVFTPVYLIGMLVAGLDLDEALDRVMRVFTSFIEITTEEA